MSVREQLTKLVMITIINKNSVNKHQHATLY